MFDLASFALQMNRSYAAFTQTMQANFPQGNIPVAFSEFAAASASLLKFTTDVAAYGTQWTTGAAMVAEMVPVTSALAGISLAGNITADVIRFAEAIDSGNQARINEEAVKLMAATAGALLFTAFALSAGSPLLTAASLGYLIGGFALSVVNFLKDPLILDLDGDGIELSSLTGSTVHFDYAGDGFAERTGWVSSDDGILAIDDNENSIVDDGLELFGSATQDGFAVLERLDTNGDGSVDAQDADFGKLRVWQDLNQNGVSDAGELKTLAELDIKSISLSRQEVNGANQGNNIGYEGTFTRVDQSTGGAQTVYFQTDPRQSIPDQTPEFAVAAGVEKLPQLSGSGLINSIAYKATNDVDFRDAWTALTDAASTMSASELRSCFQVLLLQWADVEEVDPASRGPFVDARHLSFVEKFVGDNYREINRDDEVRTYPSTLMFGQDIERKFQVISNVLEVIFLAQVGQSIAARDGDPNLVLNSPYLFYGLLELSPPGPGTTQPDTPANIGFVVDLISTFIPNNGAASYIVNAMTGLEGLIPVYFAGNRSSYVAAVSSHLAVIADDVIRTIATHIVDGTAFVGSTGAEGINGTLDANVFIGGGGGDLISGDAGSDIYVYGKHDGDLWIKDTGGSLVEVDRLVLTDLNSTDVTFDRIGDHLLIRVTSTGKTILSESFFSEFTTQHQGIDVIRFADGTEWGRSQIKSLSVYQGDGHDNAITDSALDDVIHGSSGDDYISIGQGSDTILYGRGDGYDVVRDTDSSTAATERDTLVLTDLTPNDVELSRIGSDLFIQVKASGEYIQFASFFSFDIPSWNNSRSNIDQIRFSNGVVWDRALIQENAWYRGDDQRNALQGQDLDDTLVGGKGDDVLDGGRGSDTYIWQKGDGNDDISDPSESASEVDTIYFKDVLSSEVTFSYQGSTLVITVNPTGENIRVSNVLRGATNLLEGTSYQDLDVIRFANGETLNKQQIFARIGGDYLGLDYTVETYIIASLVQWSYFTDEFGNQGNIIGHYVPGPHDIYKASVWGSFLDARFSLGEAHNSLIGEKGNDTLIGGYGKDVLIGDDGNDQLFGDFIDGDLLEGDNDVLQGGDGNDLLVGGAGSDSLDGGTGNDFVDGGAGKDVIFNGTGDDIFVGGKGNDIITSGDSGSRGSDTFVYFRGDGDDLIEDSTYGWAEASTDVLFLPDINADEIELSRSGDDLLVKVISTGEIIRIVRQFENETIVNGPEVGIELIRFGNGTEWDRARIQNEAWYRGSDVRDNVDGSVRDDTIEGGKGDDVLGGWMNTRGNDTYVYARGDGNDIISDLTYGFSESSTDTLMLKDIEADEVELSRSGDDLLVKVISMGEVIRVVRQFENETVINGSEVGIELIRFSDGIEWSRARIQSEAWYRGSDVRDNITASVRDDTIEGGKGDDVLGSWMNTRGNDTYVYASGDGNDVIDDPTYSFVEASVDTLLFRDVNASGVTLSRSGNDLVVKIIATDETITVINQFSEDANAPGRGIEFIRFADGAQWGRETILGIATSSSPFIAGTNGSDVLLGSSVAQNIYGENGNDTIDGQGGSDLLYGGLGDDTFKINISAPADLITVNGGVGIDTLDMGGFGAAVWLDLVTSGAELRTTDQTDLASGTWRDIAQIEKVENVIGSAFADQISGDAGNNLLSGGAGSDVLDGRSGDDVLIGEAGDDLITGGMGDDRLDGGEGSDSLNGGIGVDTLVGGLGDDLLSGGTEGDVFVFDADSGRDVISDFVAGAGEGHDVIRFDRSVFADFSSVLLASTQVGSDVVIATSNGSITLENVSLLNLVSENFEFRRLDNQAPTAITLDGGEVAENATAGTVVGILGVLDANDGGSHTFSIVGGSADLFEIVGSEIRIKSGADLDFESASILTLNVTATDDDGLSVTSSLSIHLTDVTENVTGTLGDDVLTGGAGDDVFTGGAGNDRLVGGAGSDVYQYNLGDGDDRIVEGDGAIGNDRLVLGAGIAPSNILIGRSSLNTSDIVLRTADGGTIILEGQLSSAEGSGLEELEFGDGTIWSRADILNHLDAGLVLGTSQDDNLLGAEAAETFEAGPGNDTIRGYGGGDTYRYAEGDGNDTIFEGYEAGTDRLELVGLTSDDIELSRVGLDLFVRIVSSDETIKVANQFNVPASGIEEMIFSDAIVWNRAEIASFALARGTSGDDVILGTFDDDILDAGLGNDVIQAGGGSDTIVYALGDGSDIINDGANSPTQIDVLRFVDLADADLVFRRHGANLTIEVVSTGEVITVVGQFASASDYWGLEEIHFSDNTVWNRTQILLATAISGTSADDILTGTSGDDVFVGGLGNDRFNSGAGSDTYVYALGDGNDYIDDESSSTIDVDVLRLSDLNASDLTFSRVGVNLVATVNSNGQTITVDEQFYSQTSNWGIEKIEFQDGSSWSLAQINANAWIRGTSGNDTISGTSWNDTFKGGLGDDRFNSGAGSDTYVYAVGDGSDYINDDSNSTTDVDVLRLTDLNASDLTFSRVGVNLVATVNSNGQTITVDEQFYSQTSNWGIEKIEFQDGSSWNLAQINANAWIRGTGGNDTLNGSAWNDTLLGGSGNDTLTGGAGNDKFVFGAGFGQDRITDFATGIDKIEFLDGLFADSSAALAAATQSGNDTVITIDAATSILLQNVAVANLHVDDFRVA